MQNTDKTRAPLGKAVATGVVAVSVAALTSALFLAGCSVSSDDESGSTDAAATSTTEPTSITLEEWVHTYPAVYESFAQTYAVDGDADNEFSHWAQYSKELLYVAQYEDGAYSYISGTCISCKTTAFNEAYETYGDAAYAMSMTELGISGSDYFICSTCHSDIDTLELSASLVSFNTLVGDDVADVDAEVLVCGQCHNAVGQYGYTLDEDNSASDADPYRYGYDADGLYQAYVEDEQGSVDEATGAYLVAPSYSDFENFLQSNHYSLGVTCVDCHMASTVTDDEGTEYPDHNMSSSPLENEDALEYCLTCHEAQGVSSTEEMVEFYEQAESEFAELEDEANVAIEELAAALTEATSAGEEGDAIDEARDDYAKAYFFIAYCNSYNHGDSYRVAHNPTGMTDLATRALELAQEGLELLS